MTLSTLSTLTLTLTTPTQGAYQLEACICQPGYYGVDNTCAVCADGAECPGGNLMRARAGWCEVKNSEPGVASLFRHCCKPDLCPGGVAAVCDDSTAVVGVDDCAVRLLTWDSIHLVSISEGTWITCVVMLVLLLLLCFCGGAALGWRKAIQRFELRVVPTMKAPATPKSAGRSPQRLEYVEEIDGGGAQPELPSRATPPQPEAPVAPERNSRRMPLRRNHALEPSADSRMSASMPDEPPYEEPGDLVIVSLDEPPSVGPQPALVSLSSPGEGSQPGADQLSPRAAQQDLMAQQAALIATTRQAAAKLSSQGSAPPPPAGGEGGAEPAEPTELPQPSVRTPTKGAVAAAEVRPLLEATPPELEQGSPEEEEAAAAEAAVEPAAGGKKEKKKKGKKGEAEEGGEEEGSEAGGKKKKGKKGKGGDGADEEGEAEGADKKKKKKKEKK